MQKAHKGSHWVGSCIRPILVFVWSPGQRRYTGRNPWGGGWTGVGELWTTTLTLGEKQKPQIQERKFLSKTQTSDNGGDKEPGEKTFWWEGSDFPECSFAEIFCQSHKVQAQNMGSRVWEFWPKINKPGFSSCHHSGNLYVERMWALETISSSSCSVVLIKV